MRIERKIMSVAIDQIVSAVADYRKPRLFNPWSESCRTELNQDYYLQRRKSLKAHLSCENPLMIVLGQVPGFNGARFSGIPFTSEALLFDGAVPRVEYLCGQRITSRKMPWVEPSSSIVWEELCKHQVESRVLLFNAVPWHPEGKDGPLSNRTPNRVEKKAGLECLELFFETFSGVPVMALGLTASENLNHLKIKHIKLRHPANGEATMFRSGAGIFIKNLRDSLQLST
jgi:hypothetical protein